MKLDVSFAAYISVIPFLVVSFSPFLSNTSVSGFLRDYSVIVLAFLSLLLAIDLELFNAWGFRMDSTLLMYLNTPKEMMASAGSAPLFLLLFIFLASFMVGLYALRKILKVPTQFAPTHKAGAIFFIILTALLIIPIRGGLQLAPINESNAYFPIITLPTNLPSTFLEISFALL